ncbi:ATP-binding cassette domain-containing protein [Fulvivirgaceae bacterium PWU5]|uniref:ATP-binding cassette domain-containing protein n=1 Tax=Dawidia cretensis TaxID=2782350 RepID=A0AAP2GTZ6_9BACT|nr:ATP-binding cassette domain-containing protein [Dawidia cretensis]MBT1708120.1 ATP-binding cassette domain-containing protein [Dawidia cretensis]
MEALIAHEVTKRYSQHLALDRVSLVIPAQTIFGLLGPNGAGKTTLIRIVNQIIQADEGTITLFGERLQEKHIGTIGYLPEERGLYKKMPVGEQLIYFAQLRGMSRQEAVVRSKAWITKFEIKDWWNKKVEDLSKGMAQKVQFISTVMHEPRLIILDEPFSGFDPINAQLITKEILELKEKGCTIIFSTHRMETVEDLCDHIVLIDKSKKILEGSKRQVKETYRTHTYTVEHRGAFDLDAAKYRLIQQRVVEDDFYKSVVAVNDNSGPNQLLRDLIPVTEVHSFIEKIPTMSEIFITLVKGGNHE